VVRPISISSVPLYITLTICHIGRDGHLNAETESYIAKPLILCCESSQDILEGPPENSGICPATSSVRRHSAELLERTNEKSVMSQ
jgi:hypothetical protein